MIYFVYNKENEKDLDYYLPHRIEGYIKDRKSIVYLPIHDRKKKFLTNEVRTEVYNRLFKQELNSDDFLQSNDPKKELSDNKVKRYFTELDIELGRGLDTQRGFDSFIKNMGNVFESISPDIIIVDSIFTMSEKVPFKPDENINMLMEFFMELPFTVATTIGLDFNSNLYERNLDFLRRNGTVWEI